MWQPGHSVAQKIGNALKLWQPAVCLFSAFFLFLLDFKRKKEKKKKGRQEGGVAERRQIVADLSKAVVLVSLLIKGLRSKTHGATRFFRFPATQWHW
ncbi:hypothetical protein [Cupriavidus taiwanensis]|uniref:hypothetical protein n=1 Tax=Cupriavidus taiwanensis TaxID=164546 RepID=UPI0011C0597E